MSPYRLLRATPTAVVGAVGNTVNPAITVGVETDLRDLAQQSKPDHYGLLVHVHLQVGNTAGGGEENRRLFG